MEIKLEHPVAEPLTEAELAGVEAAIAQIRRGEGIPLEEAREIIKERVTEWRKSRNPEAPV